MTTTLVAAFSATNVCAEDWAISSKETITDELISRDNVTVATDGNITVSGNNSGIISNGNFTMEDGSLTASSNGGSADTGVFVRGENSSVTIKNGTINLTEARIAKGEEDTDTTGDVNISGGKITLNNQAYIEMYDTNTGSVNLSGGELNINDNSGILLDGANNFTMTGGTLTATSNGKGKSPMVYYHNQELKILDFRDIKKSPQNVASYICKFKTYQTNFYQQGLKLIPYAKGNKKRSSRPDDRVHNSHLLFLDKMRRSDVFSVFGKDAMTKVVFSIRVIVLGKIIECLNLFHKIISVIIG